MHHGVDAGGRGDMGGKADGQARVKNGDIGQDNRRRHAALLVAADGDDRDGSDFRPGSGGSRHEHQRQAGALGIADAPRSVDIFTRAAQ
ncbi:hypothetical protein D3C87_1924530 [compost metagenome]